MKIQALAFLTIALFSTNASAASWNGRILRGSDLADVTKGEMIQSLAATAQVVMGEKHYTAAVQQAEAEIITLVTQQAGKQRDFTTAWEFLNASEQAAVQQLYSKFVAGEITAQAFLVHTQGPYEENYAYVPVLEATRALGGQLLATNLTRKEKSPVVKNGIGAADPKLIPPGFAMGSQGYHDRFADFMSQAGHASPQMIENYYAAQCLTDDVIAWNIVNSAQVIPATSLKFLIIGSFHTDYYDGTVARLKIRAPHLATSLVRIIDAADYETEAELLGDLQNSQYGPLADFLYIVNEPAPAQPGTFLNKIRQLDDLLELL